MKEFLVCYSHEWTGEQWASVVHIYGANVVDESYECLAGEYFQEDKTIAGVDIVHDHTV